MEQNEAKKVNTLLIAVDLGDYDIDISLLELRELCEAAGAEVVAEIVQKRTSPDTATYIGSGRLDEAKLFIENNEVELVVFDCELSGSQIKNIENVLDVRVIDRTMLILDIFATRAVTAEGKLQVELAQQRYILPRLVGVGQSMSRLGGGIGTRGPGETKLESDRRHIRRRVKALEEELERLSGRRKLIRERRKKDMMPTVSVVGYTNVGKTTLTGRLTDEALVGEDRLFATLDPTARALKLPDGRVVLLVDTVGLVRRLPHHLVQAFRSTLEEAVEADLVLNVCDASSTELEEQINVTTELLSSLGRADVPIITVVNKWDKAIPLHIPSRTEHVCKISAKTGDGMDNLLRMISELLPSTHRRRQLVLPYSHGHLLAAIRENGKIFSEEYTEDGIAIDALIDVRLGDIPF